MPPKPTTDTHTRLQMCAISQLHGLIKGNNSRIKMMYAQLEGVLTKAKRVIMVPTTQTLVVFLMYVIRKEFVEV